MAAWVDALSDIRTLLDEGNADKVTYRKRCLGQLNGENTLFKTFDNRRVTDFTSSEIPLGVWIDGVLANGVVVTDYPETGDFELSTAPDDGSVIEASYYFRWFTDEELNSFLIAGSQWLSLGDDFLLIVSGLRPAARMYAASEAYQKLAIRWTRKLSEIFMLNDAPATEDVGKMIQQYADISLKYRESAIKARDDYYSKSGMQLEANWAFSPGHVRDNVPKQ